MGFDLSELLKDVPKLDTNREQIEYIPLEKIDANEKNFYGMSDIEPLADNIALCGLQQPIRLREQEDGRYKIVSGHRRRAALLLLVSDGYEQYREAPCIVERDSASPALQQLRLIYANSNTRKMTPAEISEQAVQVEKLLYQLKEEGYDFPGRMRDHVAEAMGASKSKLARLKVIRENLAAVWVDAYKGDLIGESVAYGLSKMPEAWQTIIYKVWGNAPKSLNADTVSLIRARFKHVAEIQCDHGLNICEHTVVMMEKCAIGNNGGCYRCCFDCANLRTCKSCCPQAVSKQKEMKAVAKKANLDAKAAKEERDRPGAEFARMVWQRVGYARKQNGVSAKAVYEASGRTYDPSIDGPSQEKMETGKGKYGPESPVSMGYNIHSRDLMRIRDVADSLHCSVDYLLGRTERMELVSELGTNPDPQGNVCDSGTFWQTGDPDAPGSYILMMEDPYGGVLRYDVYQWDGAEWANSLYRHYPDIDGEILGWTPEPKMPESPKPAAGASCITGIATSGQCGAAAYCDAEYTCCLQCPEDCSARCGWLDKEDA